MQNCTLTTASKSFAPLIRPCKSFALARRFMRSVRPHHVPNDLPTVILAALVAGFPCGLLFKSAYERRLRDNLKPCLPFGHSSLPRIIGGILVKLPIALALIFLPMLGAIHGFGLYPLRGSSLQLFMFTWLLSIGAGKVSRYAYWHSKA